MDFFGGSTSSLDHLVRLRTAAINIDWKNTSVMFGQDKPIISPRDPDSLAQVGYSPLTGAGNLWLWQPQARVEQRFSLGENSGLARAGGVYCHQFLGLSPIQSDRLHRDFALQQEYPGRAPRRAWSCGIAGATPAASRSRAATTSTRTVSSKPWFPPRSIRSTGSCGPISKLEFSGMFFHGQNVATLGALPQGFFVTPYGDSERRAQHGRLGADPRADHGAAGVGRLWRPAGRSKFGSAYGYIGKNQGYFSNLMYRIAPNVIVSLEGGQVRTTYMGLGNRLNDHYDLAVAYLF